MLVGDILHAKRASQLLATLPRNAMCVCGKTLEMHGYMSLACILEYDKYDGRHFEEKK